MKKIFFDVMCFLGLIDSNNQLSRTNLLLYIFIYKFMMVNMVDASINELISAIISLIGLGGAMGLYAHKKNLNIKSTNKSGDVVK